MMSDPGQPNGWPTTWSKMYVNRTRVQFVWGVGLKGGGKKKKIRRWKINWISPWILLSWAVYPCPSDKSRPSSCDWWWTEAVESSPEWRKLCQSNHSGCRQLWYRWWPCRLLRSLRDWVLPLQHQPGSIHLQNRWWWWWWWEGKTTTTKTTRNDKQEKKKRKKTNQFLTVSIQHSTSIWTI